MIDPALIARQQAAVAAFSEQALADLTTDAPDGATEALVAVVRKLTPIRASLPSEIPADMAPMVEALDALIASAETVLGFPSTKFRGE